MKGKMLLVVGIMVLALGLVGAPSSWAAFEEFGITFSASGGGPSLTINMTGTGNGEWLGVNDLEAFHINDFGTASGGTFSVAVSGATVNTAFAVAGEGLNAGGGAAGCSATGGGICFAGDIDFGTTFNVDLTVTCVGCTGTFDATDPHLKVLFTVNGEPCAPGCSLLSQNIGNGNGVPEPASLMLLGAGLAGIGIWRRKAIKA